MAIVVLPRIEQENPFGQLAEVISEQALPYLVRLYANKDKIAKLSDTELTDFVDVLKRHAPELVADGKINWEKVNEWAQSGDPTKLKVATFLFDAKRMREDFANAPLIAKLDIIDIASSVNPKELNKIFVADKMQQKLSEAIGKSNLPDAYKLLFLANIEKFAEKPHLIPVLEKILTEAGTSSETTKTETTESGTGSWRLSLEGSKPFGIQLEEPQFVPPQVSSPQIPKIKQPSGQGKGQQLNKNQGQQPKQKSSVNNIGQTDSKTTTNQQSKIKASDDIFLPSEVPHAPDVKSMYSREQLMKAGVKALEIFGDIALGLGLLALAKNPKQLITILKSVKKGFSGAVGKIGEKEAQKVVENVAKKETQDVASKQTQNVLGQKSKYEQRREEVRKRIEEQKEKFETERNKRLPVLAPKPQRGEIVDKKVRLADYTNYDPFTRRRIIDAEPIPFIKYAKQIAEKERQKKLPVPLKDVNKKKTQKQPKKPKSKK
jgi:hypothetical protein